MATFVVGRSSVNVWKKGGHWAVTVDDVPVGGRHMTEAQAAGSALLHVGRKRNPALAGAEVAIAGARRQVA